MNETLGADPNAPVSANPMYRLARLPSDARVRIDGTPPAIQPHQARWGTLETWGELEAWLMGRVQHFDVYLSDGETAQSVGYDGQKKAEGRIAAYREVLERIAPLAAAERAERAETAAVESVEQRFKDAYGPDADKLATWQAEGR